MAHSPMPFKRSILRVLAFFLIFTLIPPTSAHALRFEQAQDNPKSAAQLSAGMEEPADPEFLVLQWEEFLRSSKGMFKSFHGSWWTAFVGYLTEEAPKRAAVRLAGAPPKGILGDVYIPLVRLFDDLGELTPKIAEEQYADVKAILDVRIHTVESIQAAAEKAIAEVRGSQQQELKLKLWTGTAREYRLALDEFKKILEGWRDQFQKLSAGAEERSADELEQARRIEVLKRIPGEYPGPVSGGLTLEQKQAYAKEYFRPGAVFEVRPDAVQSKGHGLFVRHLTPGGRNIGGYIPQGYSSAFGGRLDLMLRQEKIRVRVIRSQVTPKEGKLYITYGVLDEPMEFLLREFGKIQPNGRPLNSRILGVNPAGLLGLYQGVIPILVPWANIPRSRDLSRKNEEWQGRWVKGYFLRMDPGNGEMETNFIRLSDPPAEEDLEQILRGPALFRPGQMLTAKPIRLEDGGKVLVLEVRAPDGGTFEGTLSDQRTGLYRGSLQTLLGMDQVQVAVAWRGPDPIRRGWNLNFELVNDRILRRVDILKGVDEYPKAKYQEPLTPAQMEAYTELFKLDTVFWVQPGQVRRDGTGMGVWYVAPGGRVFRGFLPRIRAGFFAEDLKRLAGREAIGVRVASVRPSPDGKRLNLLFEISDEESESRLEAFQKTRRGDVVEAEITRVEDFGLRGVSDQGLPVFIHWKSIPSPYDSIDPRTWPGRRIRGEVKAADPHRKNLVLKLLGELPPRGEAGGMEEVRKVESAQKFLEEYQAPLLKAGELRKAQALAEREQDGLPMEVWMIPNRLPAEATAPRRVVVYVHAAPAESEEWVRRISEKLPPIGEGEKKLEFEVRPLPADGSLEKGVPIVIIKQLATPLSYRDGEVVMVFEDLAQVWRILSPQWVYSMAVNQSLRGKELSLIDSIPLKDEIALYL